MNFSSLCSAACGRPALTSVRLPGAPPDSLFLQTRIPAIDADEQRLLKMCTNLLESHYEIKEPRNRLAEDEYFKMPGRWELWNGMLQDY